MSCPFIKTCPVFNEVNLNPSESYLAWAFCRTIFSDCGRYKMILSGKNVPDGLMPTGEVIQRSKAKQPLNRIG
jgi:hypothetical protein